MALLLLSCVLPSQLSANESSEAHTRRTPPLPTPHDAPSSSRAPPPPPPRPSPLTPTSHEAAGSSCPPTTLPSSSDTVGSFRSSLPSSSYDSGNTASPSPPLPTSYHEESRSPPPTSLNAVNTSWPSTPPPTSYEAVNSSSASSPPSPSHNLAPSSPPPPSCDAANSSWPSSLLPCLEQTDRSGSMQSPPHTSSNSHAALPLLSRLHDWSVSSLHTMVERSRAFTRPLLCAAGKLPLGHLIRKMDSVRASTLHNAHNLLGETRRRAGLAASCAGRRLASEKSKYYRRIKSVVRKHWRRDRIVSRILFHSKCGKWYSVLHVRRTATRKQLKDACEMPRVKPAPKQWLYKCSPDLTSSPIIDRKLAKRCHPDKTPDDRAARAFDALRDAYDLLLDPAKRAAHDEALAREDKIIRLKRQQRVRATVNALILMIRVIGSFAWEHQRVSLAVVIILYLRFFL